MSNDETNPMTAPTRREYLAYGGAVAGSGLLAGCSAGTESGSTTEPTETEAETRTETETDTSTATETESETTSTTESYAVAMAPMGEVAFDRVPERIFTRLTHHAGMAFALGRGNDVNAMHAPDYYHELWSQFTERLEGVSLDWKGLYSSWDPDKETLYELDSDVHLTDPASVAALDSWDGADLEEIGENVAPWFGNKFSDRHGTPPDEWTDAYRYYDLWEIFERVAQVFREEARYEALAEIRADLLEMIEADLPPADRRPTAVMGGMSDVQNPYVYNVDTPGFLTAHLRPLGPLDAFGDDVSSGDRVDMEAMLEADPDVIFTLGGMHPQTDMAAVRDGLADDSVGRNLTAVENGRVYAQGARYQGPILNLFQLEMTAKQLYPDRFGEWPTYVDGPYPEIPDDEQLFDRERVAAIIRGEL